MTTERYKFVVWVRGTDDLRREESAALCAALGAVYHTSIVSDFRWTPKVRKPGADVFMQERAELFFLPRHTTRPIAAKIAETLCVFFRYERTMVQLQGMARFFLADVNAEVLSPDEEAGWFREYHQFEVKA